DRGLEMGIAEAAIATARQDEALAHLGHVHNRRLAVRLQDLRAGRDPENDVLAPGAGPVAAHAVAAALRLEVLLVAKVDEGVEPIDAFDDHVAAAAAVAAVRSAKLDVLLAAEGDRARAAVACLHIDLGLVEEFHCMPSAPAVMP